MRHSEFETIRLHLQRAVDDIDHCLTALDERERVERELCELYDLMVAGEIFGVWWPSWRSWECELYEPMVAGETPPEMKGREKPVQLTEKQEAALAGLRPNRFQVISAEQAEALAELPGEPMTDETRANLQFALRGGWRESSRQAAAWLRKAGETVAADGIDVALSRLPGELRESTEQRGYREAMRTTAGYVKTILAACMASGPEPQPVDNGQDGAQPGTPKRKRRKRASDKPRELTGPQIEAMQLYGECKGNFTEMGRRMRIDRKTAKQHYEAAAKKVGQQAVNSSPKTTTIAHDRRGQADVSEIDDARRETDSADARRFKRRG
ncbi:MAG: hypothetical protein RBS80_31340 [Thermoguttaceae bacterium]|jgi:predicted DNA-binding protein (UPF0251 family)|nr:hypothetical protein [Thermoguttaceae bacterium]